MKEFISVGCLPGTFWSEHVYTLYIGVIFFFFFKKSFNRTFLSITSEKRLVLKTLFQKKIKILCTL